jgi:glycosyltransferase involved in cell wall biosynthesis
MNVLFLTLVEINSIEERGIYQDLLRKFRNEGHNVTILTPVERRKKIHTNLITKEGVTLLQVKTLNIQKTNIFEKGIGTLAIEFQYLKAVKKHLKNQKFDLVLYSTPPITLVKVIEFIKNRDKAKTYLLLKDIFPQNAVDMKMLKTGSFLHNYFVKKEQKLYQISDTIGCMSPANVNFLLSQNRKISDSKVEVNPNTIEPNNSNYSEKQKIVIRQKYGIPEDKKILVYGGNLGKPQGIDFLLDTIRATTIENAFFLIIGDGTEFNRVNNWFKEVKPSNAIILKSLPKEDYDQLLSTCDIGMIFLDKNFTIPNFPSRLLSYLEMRIPVIAATDTITDVGDIIENAKCGYKVISGIQSEMQAKLRKLVLEENINELGMNGYKLLQKEYLVDRSYQLIINRC